MKVKKKTNLIGFNEQTALHQDFVGHLMCFMTLQSALKFILLIHLRKTLLFFLHSFGFVIFNAL